MHAEKLSPRGPAMMLVLFLASLWIVAGAETREPLVPERLKVQVLDMRAHQTDAFTQGFEIKGDFLYESTGLYGRSTLRGVYPDNGNIFRFSRMPETVFAEGLTIVEDEIYVLTWRENMAFVFDINTFEPVRTYQYEGEGWGLAYDGVDTLFMTDGSPILQVRDVESFDLLTTKTITLEGEPLRRVNELEYVDGVLYGNVWQENFIVRLDPETAEVTAVINATGLLTPEEQASADVLNGIAYNPATGTFLITGKLWPHMFEVNFVPE